jgi:hypothetical protein
MVAVRLLVQARDELTAQLLLDTAVAEYALSLSKVFTDKQQILKRVRSVIRHPSKLIAAGTSTSLQRGLPASHSAPLESATRS